MRCFACSQDHTRGRDSLRGDICVEILNICPLAVGYRTMHYSYGDKQIWNYRYFHFLLA